VTINDDHRVLRAHAFNTIFFLSKRFFLVNVFS
jgi:hypothetical protein